MKIYWYDKENWRDFASTKKGSESGLSLLPSSNYSTARSIGNSDSQRESSRHTAFSQVMARAGHWRNKIRGLKHPEHPTTLSLRVLTRLLLTPNAASYNAALRIHRSLLTRRNGEGAGDRLMPYLSHALPLKSESYPALWKQPVNQLYLKLDAPAEQARILVCFTGRAQGLNMPIPCFHATALQFFDGIAYFFDHCRDFYVSMENTIHSALEGIERLLPRSRLALLGASGGGTLVHRLLGSYQIGRRMSASPPIKEDGLLMEQLSQRNLTGFDHSRIFYAARNSIDQPQYETLQGLLPASTFSRTVYNLDWYSRSHGTLATVMELGAFSGQMKWLAEWPFTP